MSFNPSVPLVTDSPSIFPTQNQTNMGRLQTILGVDHQFNLSAAANDGYHNLIHMQIPGTLPSGAVSGYGRLYTNTSNGLIQLFYMDDGGNQYQLTPDAANLTGTVVVSKLVYTNIVTVPTNVYGEIYLFNATSQAMQVGSFYSDGTKVNAFSYTLLYSTSIVALNLGNSAGGQNLLNITVKATPPFDGQTFQYRVLYRSQ
jgi:hypothetical protein